jgi:hypothetical protein
MMPAHRQSTTHQSVDEAVACHIELKFSAIQRMMLTPVFAVKYPDSCNQEYLNIP